MTYKYHIDNLGIKHLIKLWWWYMILW